MRPDIHMKIALVVLAALVAMTAWIGDRQSSAGESSDMRRAIAEINGTYTWRGDLNRYEYSDKLRLEQILSVQPPKHAVTSLIECLDDISASASTLDGKPVALGIVCYEALTQLVYYEPTEPGGDVAASWPGFISPRASPQDMRDAKAAWKKAEAAKLLVFQ